MNMTVFRHSLPIGMLILISSSASAANKEVRTDVKPDPADPIRISEDAYPDQSRRLEEQGRSIIAVRVSKEGKITSAEVAVSSGYPRLDQASTNAFLGHHMIPATLNGKPIETTVSIPVNWTLSKPSTDPTYSSNRHITQVAASSTTVQGTPPTRRESINLYTGAVEALEKIQEDCDAYRYKAFQQEIICVKKAIATSPQLAESAVSGDLTLYTLTADNVSDEARRHVLSFSAARVNLQKAFITFRDQMNRDAAEVAAQQYRARRDTEAQQVREHEQQMRQAQVDEAQARLAAQAQSEIRRQNEMRQAEVELCFSEVERRNQTALQNLGWLGSNEVMAMQSRHLDSREICENEPAYYQSVPIPRPRPPPSMTTCQQFGQQVTCMTNQ